MNIQELEAEVARLTKELNDERAKNADLANQLEAAKEQAANMVACFRGKPLQRVIHEG